MIHDLEKKSKNTLIARARLKFMSKSLNIFIDVSALRQKNLSGVGNYLKNTLLQLFEIDKDNKYFLYSYGYKDVELNFDYSRFSNVLYIHKKLSNKFVYFTNYFFNLPKIDILKYGNEKIIADIVFLPNINICSLRYKKTQLITTIHDLSFFKCNYFFNFKRRLWHFITKPYATIKRSNHLVCVSYNTAYELEKYYKIRKDKIIITPLGINNSFRKIEDQNHLSQIKEKYALPEQFLLFIGTIEPRKNVISLINAYEKLAKEFPDLYLLICGDVGWNMGQFEKTLNKLPENIISRTMFLNYFPEADLASIYNLAKIFVWPSYYEGFGLPPLEALSCNCPVVSSNNSSMPEVVGKNALLIESFEINDIYKACKSLLNNEDLYLYYKNQVFDESYYDNWHLSAQKLLNLFNKI